MSKMLTVAVQSPEGQKRIQVSSSGKAEDLYKSVFSAFDLASMEFILAKDQKKKTLVDNSRIKSLTSLGIKHGDRLFMFPKTKTDVFKSPEETGSSSKQTAVVYEEDEVDKLLRKQDGRIERGRDNLHCQHNTNSQCVHCIPLDPFDESYLKEKQIKFMSFHSYLRKISGGVSKGKFAPLRNLSCKVEHTSRCSHQPYPQGICSKCQPSAVTLNRQPWRHVDSIMFENPKIVDRFLQFWRESGAQRAGWLYGRYEVYPEVPLGIKAVVSAIYEPPQESSKDHIRILTDPRQELVDELARNLGLVKVGWIFTDLVPGANGQVRNYRGADSHFLSAQEIISAAVLQNSNPNPCRETDDGVFGSKFVTVCVTGNKDKEIHMEGYQVSNQCMSLVKDKILVPTKDAPELAYIRESTDENYVPDVFFMEKDKYGNEIKKLGRPLPVEYLLLDVPVSSPLEPQSTFTILTDRNPFPVENRLLDSSLQDFNSFAKYVNQFRSAEFLEAVSDLHVLIFMANLDIIPLRPLMGPLLEAVRTGDREAAREWSYLDPWSNLQALIQASTMN
ncbi:nuclear protein localization protein 4 homolog isoform X2 [Eurytemora carolleeae]|uniref:nuclear protein localization protein 4 homolog isoform X2 n=1 Tax=Eurytemora carolleeae TaxID=1294199 RepID=UPI000C76665E|nr:nuclear protein localization protein 4 homolog isoform X2 [Eurytemora carolleeae]|eukprot:XP_023328940.1 nuclear protein localization protein 4 homolog isoform X2 [Eurytemora affinis]